MAVLTGATSASAAVRYAAPDATGAEPCALASPCDLLKAVNGAASGDEIVVQPGVHVLQALDSQALNPAGLTLNIHGASGQARPTIISGSSLGLKLGTNSTFANVNYSGAPLTTSGTVTIHDAVIEKGNVLIENGTGSKLYNVMVRHGRLTLNNSTNAVLNHVTVYNPATNAVAMAINAPTAPVDVVVSNSILSGFTDLTTQGNSATNSVTAHIDHSAFRTPTGGNIFNANIVDGGGNITSSDFAIGSDPHEHVANTSPTIDAGAAVAGFTPTLTTDVHGNPRVIGSAPDMGAEEFRFRPDVTRVVGGGTPTGTYVQATVNPNEGPATYYVEYGKTTAYGSKTASVTIDGLFAHTLGVPISGLTPGVRYHGRFVATNPNGITRSQDVTFTSVVGQQDTQTVPAVPESQYVRVTPSAVNGSFSQIGSSKDGTRVWFATDTAIPGTGDADTANDLYEWRQGQPLRLLSGSGQHDGVSFLAASADGSRVFFSTPEAIAGTGDTDNGIPDIFMASGGQIQLISDPAGYGTFYGISADGSKIFFANTDATSGVATLVVKDVVAGTSHLLGNSAYPFGACGINAAGTRALFGTTAPLLAADTDSELDLYEWMGGTYRLISGGKLNLPAICKAASATGDRVWFTTKERLLPSDLDADEDTYERRLDGTLRLLAPNERVVPNSSLNSLAQPHSQIVINDDPTDEMIAIADNGSKHWFWDSPATGDDVLVEEDANGARRVVSSSTFGRYIRALPGGSSVFYSESNNMWEASGGFRRATDWVRATSDDGSRLTVQTNVSHAADDTNGVDDLYQLIRPPRKTIVAKVVRIPGTITAQCQATPSDAVVDFATWTRNGVALPTSGDRYLEAKDAGQTLRCHLPHTNNYGEPAVAVSAPYIVPPISVANTAVSGARVTGNRLRCSAFMAGATSISYTWYRGRTVIGTGVRYTIPVSALGRKVRCVSTARNAGGATSLTSPTITIPLRCTVPAVRGATIAVARVRLGDAGCRTKLVYVSTTAVARGQALRTTPAAGSVRPNGTTITLSARRP